VEKESGVLIVCVYVDDLLITGSSTTVVAEFKKHLSDNFEKIKDLDDMPRYLGLSVTRMDNGQIALSQEEYIDELLEKHGLTERSPYNTPLPTDLEKYMEPGDGSVPPIMDVVGQLRYLADRTRPDIGYATSFLARFAAKPTVEHQKLAMRVLRYLKGTRSYKLVIGSPTSEVKLFAAADASFVRGGDSKAQQGYCLFLSENSGCIYSKSQKDKNVSISSFHSELNALVEAAKCVIYYRGFLGELGYPQHSPTCIYQDNISVINASSAIGSDSRTKYLITKINFINELIENSVVMLRYLPTEKNCADLNTKSLLASDTYKFTLMILIGVASYMLYSSAI
jgi:hypothetical protein